MGHVASPHGHHVEEVLARASGKDKEVAVGSSCSECVKVAHVGSKSGEKGVGRDVGVCGECKGHGGDGDPGISPDSDRGYYAVCACPLALDTTARNETDRRLTTTATSKSPVQVRVGIFIGRDISPVGKHDVD